MLKKTKKKKVLKAATPEERREEILESIEDVPSIPLSAARVIELVNDPYMNVAELARTIELDPGLTANVLRLANSAYFGCSRMISSVAQAIVRLGTNNIFELVMATSIAPMARRPLKGYDTPAGGLWEHLISVAIAVDQLAKILKLRVPDHASSAGLLHDIGKIVLGTFIEVDAVPIMQMAFHEHVAFDEAERRILGIDHAEVGALLLDRWNIPEPIVEAVRWHHEPERYKDDTKVVDLVHAANIISLMAGIGRGNDGLNYTSSDKVVSRLALTTPVIEKTICEMLDKLKEARELFSADAWR